MKALHKEDTTRNQDSEVKTETTIKEEDITKEATTEKESSLEVTATSMEVEEGTTIRRTNMEDRVEETATTTKKEVDSRRGTTIRTASHLVAAMVSATNQRILL